MYLYLTTKKMGAIVLVVVSGLIGGGCAALPPSPPAPGALLSGTWIMTTDNPTDLPTTYLTYDTVGLLTNITFGLPDKPVIIDQTLLGGSTSVIGNEIIIAESFAGGIFNFAGVLNNSGTMATGNLTTVINLTFFVLTVENAPATMIKQ